MKLSRRRTPSSIELAADPRIFSSRARVPNFLRPHTRGAVVGTVYERETDGDFPISRRPSRAGGPARLPAPPPDDEETDRKSVV